MVFADLDLPWVLFAGPRLISTWDCGTQAGNTIFFPVIKITSTL